MGGKLTVDHVHSIRRQRAAGTSLRAIADAFDISVSLAGNIHRRTVWAHVPDESGTATPVAPEPTVPKAVEAPVETEHDRRKALLERCDVGTCDICHPPNHHLWKIGGRASVWRMVNYPDLDTTAGPDAAYAQVVPFLKPNSVPAIIRAIANDGRVYQAEVIQGRNPGESLGVVQVKVWLNTGGATPETGAPA